MPDYYKINKNKDITAATLPDIIKLIEALFSSVPVNITNQEIDRAMIGIESGYKADLESLPDEDYEYKHKQEITVQNLSHYMGEFLKQANTYRQQKLQEKMD